MKKIISGIILIPIGASCMAYGVVANKFLSYAFGTSLSGLGFGLIAAGVMEFHISTKK